MRSCPGPEELVDYQEGYLSETEVRRVRHHLVVCAECARMVLDLEIFDTGSPDLVPTTEETGEDWVRFREESRRRRPRLFRRLVGWPVLLIFDVGLCLCGWPWGELRRVSREAVDGFRQRPL